jgi:hypothetical protein
VVSDRYRQPEEEEDWESTFNAALPEEDLKKALEPFNALL